MNKSKENKKNERDSKTCKIVLKLKIKHSKKNEEK